MNKKLPVLLSAIMAASLLSLASPPAIAANKVVVVLGTPPDTANTAP